MLLSTLGMLSEVLRGLVAPRITSWRMASSMVRTGVVCHATVTSTTEVSRPSQPNRVMSKSMAGFLRMCSSAIAWVIMPIWVPSRGAWW